MKTNSKTFLRGAVFSSLLFASSAASNAVEFIDTFDTAVDPAKWLQQDSRPVGPFPERLVVEGGKVVAKANQASGAGGLVSVATYTLENDFTASLDVAVGPLLPSEIESSNGSFGITLDGRLFGPGAGVGLSRQLNSAAEWDSYQVGIGATGVAVSQMRGDMNYGAGDPIQNDWPLETQRFTLEWDADLGELTASYDGFGGRQAFAPLLLFTPGSPFTPTSTFRFTMYMDLSEDLYDNNRTAASFDNFSFQQVPEPGGAALMLLAGGMAGFSRRRSRAETR